MYISKELKKQIQKIERVKKDPVYFIENYVMVNAKPMVLTDNQKKFLRGYFGNTGH
jgi:hypothetical protein